MPCLPTSIAGLQVDRRNMGASRYNESPRYDPIEETWQFDTANLNCNQTWFDGELTDPMLVFSNVYKLSLGRIWHGLLSYAGHFTIAGSRIIIFQFFRIRAQPKQSRVTTKRRKKLDLKMLCRVSPCKAFYWANLSTFREYSEIGCSAIIRDHVLCYCL